MAGKRPSSEGCPVPRFRNSFFTIKTLIVLLDNLELSNPGLQTKTIQLCVT
jgi:hypothetical protein